MPRILIDANIYLELFSSMRLARLADTLDELREEIFVSRQLVNEVGRNKLRAAASFLGEQVTRLKALGISSLPLDLLASDEGAPASQATLAAYLEAVREVENRATSYLAQVSSGTDRVSRRLARLFQSAVDPTEEQVARARARREVGNPPGKSEDALGDQLTWEAWLDHMGAHQRLWLITNDQDFFTRFGGSRFLNPVLQADVDRRSGGTVRVRVFDRLAEGLDDFRRSAEVSLLAWPSADDLVEMSREVRLIRQRGAPPFPMPWQSTPWSGGRDRAAGG